jgi:Spy/CpxP family protein refolding chaperone
MLVALEFPALPRRVHLIALRRRRPRPAQRKARVPCTGKLWDDYPGSSLLGRKILMKRTLAPLLPIALLFALGLAAPARAQQSSKPTPPKDAAPSKDTTAAKPYGNADAPENDPALQLTDDQKVKIKTIRDDANQQIQAAQKDASLTDDQKERRIKLIRKTARAQVFAVLTPDQQKIWSWEQHEKRDAKSQPTKSQ